MTKPLFILAGVLVAVAGCHAPLGTYRNLNRWLLPQGNDRRPLNGHPREVTEYTYMAADTTIPEKKRTLYLKYGFNADGDLVSGQTYVNDTLALTSANRFDANGLQQTVTNVKTGESVQTVTERLSDGRYKTVANHARSAPTIAYTSFTGGNKSEVEQGSSGNHSQNQGPADVHIYYNGYRIEKVTSTSIAGDLEERFFYSRWDTPDSVDVFTGKGSSMRLMQRQVYEINDHGDPVRSIQLAGKDTTAVDGYQYVYDQQGNWTRKVTIQLRSGVPNMPVMPARVTDRVYTY